MRCAIYARVSSEQQRENTSIDQQLADCRDYAKRQSWLIAGEYIDIAESGRKNSRPELQRMLRDVEAGGIDVVLVWKMDRLARNTRQALELIESNFKSIQFASVTEPIDRLTAGGKFGLTMQLSAAQFYSDLLSERIKRARRYQAERGEWVGLEPFGYRRNDHGVLAPTADAPTVREMFASYARGLTFGAIATMLNQRGLQMYNCRTKRHNAFGRENVRFIIRNRAYIGKVSSGGTEYPGQHEPLITEALWVQCQTLRGERTRNRRRPARSHSGLLSGIVHCSTCGSLMWLHISHTREGIPQDYYRCSKAASWQACEATMCRTAIIDGLVLEYLMSIELSPGIISSVLRSLDQAQPPAVDRGKIAAQIDRLVEVYTDGGIDRTMYQKRRAALDTQLQAAGDVPAINPDSVRAMLADFPRLLGRATQSERQQLIGVFFNKVWVQQNTLTAVTPNAIYMELVHALRVQASVSGVADGYHTRRPHFTTSLLWGDYRIIHPPQQAVYAR